MRLWGIHLLAFGTLIACAALDPLFGSFWPVWHFETSTGHPIGRVLPSGIALLVAGATLSAIVIRTGLRSTPKSRSLLQLLAITAVIALWCSFSTCHHALAWHGKRLRFAFRTDQLESLAAPLRRSWPTEDGKLEGLGPFMAYPFGTPQTLLLLEAPRLDGRVYVAAIEQGETGAIRMQIMGTDGGDWVEWHPDDGTPSSFIGGLGDQHQLAKFDRIGRGWYLARYQSTE
ncbi:MAG: hypothetical protein AAFX06_27715 [Planctomycetota bacterium]